MKVVVPFQNREWDEVIKIAGEWVKQQPNLADAWYFLGVAELESKLVDDAKLHLKKTTELDSRHLEALLKLSEIAINEQNFAELDKVINLIKPLDAVEAEQLSVKVAGLKKD